GTCAARRWYWAQVTKSIPMFLKIQMSWSITMFKNYLKIALRNVRRNKGYSFINISGLAVGMACCLLILIWINHEMSYDRFHEHSDSIYRLAFVSTRSDQQGWGTPYPLGPVIKDNIPEIEEVVRLSRLSRRLVTSDEKRFFESNIISADPSILKIFSFSFIKGDPESVLTSPSSMVVTQTAAAKYFGSEDPLGKILRINNRFPFTVTGVIADIPDNSSLRFDFLTPLEFLRSIGAPTNWGAFSYDTYFLLKPNVEIQDVDNKIEKLEKPVPHKFVLHPFNTMRLFGINDTGVIRSVSLFSFLAFLVLLIACINYINLTTARSANRAKEIGLRKVVGAHRKDIIRQFFGESIVFAIIALCFAFVLVLLFLPTISRIAGSRLSINLALHHFILIEIVGILLLTGIFAGCYPAVFLSSFRPVKVFKGILYSGKRNSILRKGLVVGQFIVSITLIIGTLLINQQLRFVSHRNPGFKKENLIYMPMRGEENLWQKYKIFKQELEQQQDIGKVTASTCLPVGGMIEEWGQMDWKDRDPEERFGMSHMAVDSDFLETFQIELIDGRFFSDDLLSDEQNFVLNEAAVKATKLQSPVGERFSFLERKGQIIGVVKDFHFDSLHTEIEPLVLQMMPYSYWAYRHLIFVQVKSSEVRKTLATLEKLWKKHVPEYPFEFHFLDSSMESLYSSEQRLRTILRYFTFVSLFISCLGLFGLVSFSVERKTKEIGIRKVLGASVGSVIHLASKEYIGLVAISNVFAWPTAYYFMHRWLQNFAYRINFSIWIFILSGLTALLIALLMVSFQCIKAATANPVNSLRYE
ncbi:MAG: ABC transporter permease, partial [Candidatus Aminicenantes bacterium]|nr:ABC transporter permease [Candidatus Aminicenantes bacterium]